MANKGLFASAVARLLPAADTRNREYAPAYAYGPEHKLAQLAATGTLQDAFYADAETQLAEVLEAARAVDPLFVAKAAVYARTRATMKDMPALLAAYLTVADPDLAVRVFGRVVDNGRLLRQYATWRLLPRLRTRAGQRALPNSAARHTALQFTVAEQFLAWQHQHDRKLSETRQADLDTWHVENLLHNQRALRDFLNWAMTSRHMPKLKPPALRPIHHGSILWNEIRSII